jgi:hypothetical protein
VVVTYFEDRQEIAVQAVDHARAAPIVAGELEMPILLDEQKFRLDDAFARRLGSGILTPIALGQPVKRAFPSDRLRAGDQCLRMSRATILLLYQLLGGHMRRLSTGLPTF